MCLLRELERRRGTRSASSESAGAGLIPSLTITYVSHLINCACFSIMMLIYVQFTYFDVILINMHHTVGIVGDEIMTM